MADLKQYIDQINQSLARLAEEKAHLKDIKQACKLDGFDIKVVNRIVREMAMDSAKLREYNDMTDTYKVQLGLDL